MSYYGFGEVCTPMEASDCVTQLTAYLTNLATAMNEEFAAGKIKADDSMWKAGEALAADMQAGGLAVKPGSVTWPDPCASKRLCESFIARASAIGDQLEKQTGRKNPVKGATPPPSPEPPIGLLDLVKWGLIIGIGYVGYRWMKEVTSDAYPVDKLPQYAGGKRKR